MYGRSYQVEEEELESKTKPNIMKVDVTHVEATRAVTPHWNAYAILYQDPMLCEILLSTYQFQANEWRKQVLLCDL